MFVEVKAEILLDCIFVIFIVPTSSLKLYLLYCLRRVVDTFNETMSLSAIDSQNKSNQAVSDAAEQYLIFDSAFRKEYDEVIRESATNAVHQKATFQKNYRELEYKHDVALCQIEIQEDRIEKLEIKLISHEINYVKNTKEIEILLTANAVIIGIKDESNAPGKCIVCRKVMPSGSGLKGMARMDCGHVYHIPCFVELVRQRDPSVRGCGSAEQPFVKNCYCGKPLLIPHIENPIFESPASSSSSASSSSCASSSSSLFDLTE